MKMIQHICGLKLVSDAFKNIIYSFFDQLFDLKIITHLNTMTNYSNLTT